MPRAISSNCGGYSNAGTNYGPAVSFTGADQIMWDFTNMNNQSIAPNGPGAAGTLAYWGRQADCQNPGSYFANITLTGACYIEGGPAPCVADVDDGSGTGTPDAAVTIDDLLYYIERFADGC